MATSDPVIDAVFAGRNVANAAVDGFLGAMNNMETTFSNIQNAVNNPNPQQQFNDQYSRRNFGGYQPSGFCQQQQQPAYQPASYVWGSSAPMQTNGMNGGYPGISNPNYGKTGYAGAAFPSAFGL